MKKAKLTQQVLMALLLGSSLLGSSTARAAELTITTDQAGDVSLPGSGNTLTIESGTIDGYAYGGYKETGDVAGNTVTMNGGTANRVYGGYVESGSATGNTVTMNNGTVVALYGGDAGSGDATGNTVTMNGGTVRLLNGGYAGSGSATGNTVTMNGGTVSENVYGGHVGSGSATGNTVTMNNGTVLALYGGDARLGSVTGNTVTMNSGTAECVYGGDAGSGSATGNTVTMNGGTVSREIYGGYADSGSATGNTVTINGGTISGSVYGGDVYNGDATGNTVTINGGTISESVYGGSAPSGDATGNTVTINGGTISGIVYGGIASSGAATRNVVNLYGGNLTSAYICGGDTEGSGSSTGNTLNVYAPLTVDSIFAFQNYNFYIPASFTGSLALLTVSATAKLGTGSTVSAIGIAGDSAYTTNSKITLLSGSSVSGSLASNTVTAQKGFATAYAATLSLTTGKSGTITATLGAASVNPKVKALSEVQSAALANLNTGADLTAGSGLENALTAAGSGQGQAVGFVGTTAGQETISTGSEVDGRSFGLMAGAAAAHAVAAGQLTTGVFAEAGWGSFTTKNEVSGTTVNSDGHSNYEGGGFLARLDRPNGTWYEGSLRVGHMDSAYSSSDVTDYDGSATSYSVGSPYYSAHLGIGHCWQRGAKAEFAVYGKYLWSHIPSRSVTVAGDAFDFAAVSSNRLRLGARWTKRCDDGSVYAGLAAEREFSGSQHATAAGWDLAAPSLSGTTGIVELGWRVPRSAAQPIAIDLSLTGLFGKRQGIAGGLSFSWGW